jgi:hypothetical protein
LVRGIPRLRRGTALKAAAFGVRLSRPQLPRSTDGRRISQRRRKAPEWRAPQRPIRPSDKPFAVSTPPRSAIGVGFRLGSLAMHLRAPSIDRGTQSFVWAVVFFLFLYFGMVAIEVAKSTALIVSLVSGFVIFLLVRTRGQNDPRDS